MSLSTLVRMSLAASAVVTAVSIAPTSLACGDPGSQSAEKTGLKKVTVAELADMLSAKVKPAVLDVNSAKTRAAKGVIPGAVLLSGASSYDVAAELPADRQTSLVFYCANRFCNASTTAAERALESGYSDVAVLKAGIEGWREAGKKVARVEPSGVKTKTPGV